MKKKDISLFLFLASFLVLFNSNQNIKKVSAVETQGTVFTHNFDDVSQSDIGYKAGNNKSFMSHGLNYYASSFAYNSTKHNLYFGRNLSATTNLSDTDELRMEYDIGGVINYVKLNIGTKNGNINLKTMYSINQGKDYYDIEGSEQAITKDSDYSIYLNNRHFTSVRYKFVITNVNNVAGKNMVINSISLIGNDIYTFDLSNIIKKMDSCNCNNVMREYEGLITLYEALNEDDRYIFNNLLTEDEQTTYIERLRYFEGLCGAKEISDYTTSISVKSYSALNIEWFYVVLIGVTLTSLIVCLKLKKKQK